MTLKDFVLIGSKVGQIDVYRKAGKYRLFIRKDGWNVTCETTRFEVREWHSLDVISKHLNQHKFTGELKIMFTNQLDLIPS